VLEASVTVTTGDKKEKPMNTFRKLWQAVETLAASLTGLTETVDALNDQVRQWAGLGTAGEPLLLPDRNGEPEPAALPAGRKRSKM
jgi:hypothetical protein